MAGPFDKMTDAIYVSEPTGVDINGTRTYSDYVKMDAVIQPGFNRVLDKNRNEVLSQYVIYHKDKITMHARVIFDKVDRLDDSVSQQPINIQYVASRISGTKLYRTFF